VRVINSSSAFPSPWTVEALDGGFKIVDANGQTLAAYVYGHADPRDAQVAKALTLDEARRIASIIAKLPDLLQKVRPDDNIQAVSNLSDERHEADTTPNDEP
jgi:K+/H+ antiporter YhaU regulatory subunit KhtT